MRLIIAVPQVTFNAVLERTKLLLVSFKIYLRIKFLIFTPLVCYATPVESSASKDFKKLDPQLQKRIKTKIEEVAEDPIHYKHLHYDLKGSCRLWVGKLRIIFSYDEKKEELYLEKIVFGHKYKD